MGMLKRKRGTGEGPATREVRTGHGEGHTPGAGTSHTGLSRTSGRRAGRGAADGAGSPSGGLRGLLRSFTRRR